MPSYEEDVVQSGGLFGRCGQTPAYHWDSNLQLGECKPCQTGHWKPNTFVSSTLAAYPDLLRRFLVAAMVIAVTTVERATRSAIKDQAPEMSNKGEDTRPHDSIEIGASRNEHRDEILFAASSVLPIRRQRMGSLLAAFATRPHL